MTTDVLLKMWRAHVHLYRLVLLLAYFGGFDVHAGGRAIKRVGEEFLSNLIQEDSFGEAECDTTIEQVLIQDRRSQVDGTPRLQGHWVSQRCEIRPGPVFLLRSVQFSSNFSFQHLVHYYSDASCTYPTYSVLATGSLTLRGPSWTTVGAARAHIKLEKLSVFPHIEQAVELLSQNNQYCTGLPHRQRLKKRKEYVIYTTNGDEACTEKLRETLAELEFLKTQTREVDGRKVKELLLGNDRQKFTLGINDAPSLFQPPLLHTRQRHVCGSCRAVTHGSAQSPPHLQQLPRLPPYLGGEWISQHCEPHPLGIFIFKRLNFDSEKRTWKLQAQLFSDPLCSKLAFSVVTEGTFQKGTTDDVSNEVDGAIDLDLNQHHFKVLVKDRALNSSLVLAGCLPCSSKCKPLGIKVPSKVLSIVRLEIDQLGSPLLYIGLPQSNRRSTSYQQPLTQCTVFAPLPVMLPLTQNSSSSALHISQFSQLCMILIVISYSTLDAPFRSFF